jgi:phosphoadenosine phosphosulfate reductase
MRRTLMNFDAWISGLRRDQAQTRATIEPIDIREVNGRPLVRLHPIATWSRLDVMRYMTEHDLPRHPLLEQGYTSIGCWPCTQPVQAGEGERAGRWPGIAKTECGLHQLGRRTGGEM